MRGRTPLRKRWHDGHAGSLHVLIFNNVVNTLLMPMYKVDVYPQWIMSCYIIGYLV